MRDDEHTNNLKRRIPTTKNTQKILQIFDKIIKNDIEKRKKMK